MGTVSSERHRVSLIGMIVFGFALTTTWVALLGYGLFRLGEWAIADWRSALNG
jgi:hypothetical protein